VLAACARERQTRPFAKAVPGCWREHGSPFADGVMERLKATVQVVKRNELHALLGRL